MWEIEDGQETMIKVSDPYFSYIKFCFFKKDYFYGKKWSYFKNEERTCSSKIQNMVDFINIRVDFIKYGLTDI
jgi:hypothetical protein